MIVLKLLLKTAVCC